MWWRPSYYPLQLTTRSHVVSWRHLEYPGWLKWRFTIGSKFTYSFTAYFRKACSILPCIVMFTINSEYFSHWYSYACLTKNGESAFQYLRCPRWRKTNEEGLFQVFLIENPFWRPSIIMTELICLCKRLCNLWWHVVFDIADLQTFQWHHLDRHQQTWCTTELPTLKNPSFSVNFFRRFWKTCNNLLHHFVRSCEKLFFFISTENGYLTS